jgi:hypothetical protein
VINRFIPAVLYSQRWYKTEFLYITAARCDTVREIRLICIQLELACQCASFYKGWLLDDKKEKYTRTALNEVSIHWSSGTHRFWVAWGKGHAKPNPLSTGEVIPDLRRRRGGAIGFGQRLRLRQGATVHLRGPSIGSVVEIGRRPLRLWIRTPYAFKEPVRSERGGVVARGGHAMGVMLEIRTRTLRSLGVTRSMQSWDSWRR